MIWHCKESGKGDVELDFLPRSKDEIRHLNMNN